MSEKDRKDSKTLTEEVKDKLVQAINDIEFGTVTVVIQNGIVVQIEKNEKIRLV